jgi:hypothetical protein
MAADSATVLVETVQNCLPEDREWDEREAALLELASRQAADVDRLEADIVENGVRLSDGRLNPAFGEVRQGRVALARILAGVDVPDGASMTTLRARKAAEARWDATGAKAPLASSQELRARDSSAAKAAQDSSQARFG